MKKLVLGVLAVISIIAAAFLIFSLATAKGKNLESTDAFVKELEARGYKVVKAAQITEDKMDFGVPRQSIAVENAIFNVYEFSGADEAKKFSSYISTNGLSIKTLKRNVYTSWSGLPHYYCSGSIIVLYVGRNLKILTDMHMIMGRQFAGAKWYEVLLSRKGLFK